MSISFSVTADLSRLDVVGYHLSSGSRELKVEISRYMLPDAAHVILGQAVAQFIALLASDEKAEIE